jgi:hypothetical protein
MRIQGLRQRALSRRVRIGVGEATINHVSGFRAGVAGTYNRALYLDERKSALDAWAGYALRIVGETDERNVTALPAAQLPANRPRSARGA